MKYIKTYEILFHYEKGRPDLIPGYMYLDGNITVGYIGHNGSRFPLLCFIFRKNYRGNFDFIDWVESLDLKPMNMTIKDYIIQNDIVSKTLRDIKKKDFASGPSGIDKKLIKNFEQDLLSDERIKMQIDTEKYNL